jgi:uncharacterized protein YndB with AHSA1/START domain
MEDQPASYELNISRIFAAPRQAVYQAFVTAELLPEWLAPAGWLMPDDQLEIDPRPGGKLRYLLINADDASQRLTATAQFGAVAEGEVVTWIEVRAADGPVSPVGRTLRVELHDEPGGATRLEFRQGPYTRAGEAAGRESWNSAFARLDSLLELRADTAV